jgi:hypothetical protein
MRRILGLSSAIVLLAASAALGQAPTTVQLPTFHFFTVQTTVGVPDSGGASLGGISRAYDSSRMRGLGPLAGSRGAATGRSTSGMTVHATIHDLPALDEALLAEAAAKRGAPLDLASTAKAAALAESVGGPKATAAGAAPGTGVLSVAAIREQNQQAARVQAGELAAKFAKAQQAERENKPVVARIYYEMVTRGDSGPLRQLAQARLDVVSGKSQRVVGR